MSGNGHLASPPCLFGAGQAIPGQHLVHIQGEFQAFCTNNSDFFILLANWMLLNGEDKPMSIQCHYQV